jgi:hypothetical protein
MQSVLQSDTFEGLSVVLKRGSFHLGQLNSQFKSEFGVVTGTKTVILK